jgi:hypothetical protein
MERIMKRFKCGMRVRIVSHKDVNMIGNEGTVYRLRIADNGAWVRMDKRLATEWFPFGDMDSRSNHTLLSPDQCEKAGK